MLNVSYARQRIHFDFQGLRVWNHVKCLLCETNFNKYSIKLEVWNHAKCLLCETEEIRCLPRDQGRNYAKWLLCEIEQPVEYEILNYV